MLSLYARLTPDSRLTREVQNDVGGAYWGAACFVNESYTDIM